VFYKGDYVRPRPRSPKSNRSKAPYQFGSDEKGAPLCRYLYEIILWLKDITGAIDVNVRHFLPNKANSARPKRGNGCILTSAGA
jgi:hypothetical protein